MSFSAKFNRRALGVLLATSALAGCVGEKVPGTSLKIVQETCTVMDEHLYADGWYRRYDFQNEMFIKVSGHAAAAIPMKDLPQAAQAKALEMFKLLPDSAKCIAPSFKP